MKRDEFLFGKLNYKYQPSSCVNFSNAVSTQSIPVFILWVLFICSASNKHDIQNNKIIKANVM